MIELLGPGKIDDIINRLIRRVRKNIRKKVTFENLFTLEELILILGDSGVCCRNLYQMYKGDKVLWVANTFHGYDNMMIPQHQECGVGATPKKALLRSAIKTMMSVQNTV